MHLWTEYEGRTIAESYTLGKLLRSEGRNGFFATSDKDGHPAVIRLTEAHFDEDEQLKRWRQVANVHQDNLIEIDQVGQTTLEGVALTYALMEPDDANLGDVLKERPLTTAETTQVARSVLAALIALHERGLVHEHVEAANVLAVGEIVKLRSDCVRECVVDGEFTTPEACAALRRRDIHDYGVLLLQCLTLEREPSSAHNLAEPFRRIVPSALDGTWSLQQIGTVLDPVAFAPQPAAPPYHAASNPAAPSYPASTGTKALGPQSPNRTGTDFSSAPVARPLVPPALLQHAAADAHAATLSASGPPEPTIPVRTRYQAEHGEHASTPSRGLLIGAGAALLLVVLLLWHFLDSSKTAHPATSVPVAAPRPATSSPVAAHSARPAVAATEATRSLTRTVSAAPGWYVIAFTYNHEGQAQAKVVRLRRNHNSLHPQLFTPTGRAPFFVSLGGPMSQSDADTVFRHARRAGLPRDTFVRHY